MLRHMLVPVVAIGLLLPALAVAEDAQPPSPAAVEQIELAATLARYGEARKDPILMIAAAKIAKGLTAEAPPALDKIPSVDEMLADAAEYSEGDEGVKALIDDVKGAQSKGYCYGAYGLGWC